MEMLKVWNNISQALDHIRFILAIWAILWGIKWGYPSVSAWVTRRKEDT